MVIWGKSKDPPKESKVDDEENNVKESVDAIHSEDFEM